MPKIVIIGLGSAPTQLASRTVTVTPLQRAGNPDYALAQTPSVTATDESVAVTLADNLIWEVTLQDTLETGEVGQKHGLIFNTGSLQFPGPRNGPLSVIAMEDLSSSSSSSSSNSSSSSSTSSGSSSSSSSSSSISSQSSSSSSSSVNSSSSSSSSVNSSSSSSSNSSSSSSSNSSSSSSSSS